MPHDPERRSRKSDALVTRPTRDPVSLGEASVVRKLHTDPRTNAKSVYQRGTDGSEVYASYYNSQDDPTFQQRNGGRNSDGTSRGGQMFVQSACFAYSSHGNGGGTRSVPERSRRPVIVEEADSDTEREKSQVSEDRSAVDVNFTRSAAQLPQTHVSRTPIVEEPDAEEGEEVVVERCRKSGRAAGHHRGTAREVAPRSVMQPDSFFEDFFASAAPPHARSRQGQQSPSYTSLQQQQPLAPRGMMGGSVFEDDFFGPRSMMHDPFRMMDAMHQRMRQQHASMFGGFDPFANFF